MAKKITKRQQAFLDAYRELGFVHGAALKAGVSRELHYNAMRVSKPYREAFREIEQTFALKLEEEARRLAVIGEVVPVYYGRKLVGFRNRPSDRLLIFLLKANNPEKFVEPLRRRRRQKPDSRAKSRRSSASASFSWKRMSRALRNQSLSGVSGRRGTRRKTPESAVGSVNGSGPMVALQADLPISEPAPVEVRKPDSGEIVPGATEVGAQGCLVGSTRERLRRGQGRAPAPQQAHAQCLRPHTDHW